jgi:Zn finger protein HypA/HybF involved in hydrogenase expression
MHEVKLAQRVAESLLAELDKHPGARARRVVVVLSQLSGVAEDLFRHGFAHAAEGTGLAEADLVVREVAIVYSCPECHRMHEEDEGECLDCGTPLLPARPPDARIAEFIVEVPD